MQRQTLKTCTEQVCDLCGRTMDDPATQGPVADRWWGLDQWILVPETNTRPRMDVCVACARAILGRAIAVHLAAPVEECQDEHEARRLAGLEG